MIGRLRVLMLTGTALVIALVASGCGGTQVNALPQQPGLPGDQGRPGGSAPRRAAGVDIGRPHKRIRFFMITHGQASDPFWAVVQNGAEAAAAQLGVSVTYEAPDTYDIVRMREMIRNATETRPAGLVVSLPNPSPLAAAIRAAEKAGIPVVSINSGSHAFRRLGTLLHVGEDEYDAGYAAGRRMSVRHVRHALCVIHEAGNLDLEQRCHGLCRRPRRDRRAHQRARRKPPAHQRGRAADRRDVARQGVRMDLTARRCGNRRPDPGRPTERPICSGRSHTPRSASARRCSTPIRAGQIHVLPSTSSPICRATCRSCC